MSNFKTIENRKAKFEYQTIKTFECGIILKGTEVKSILNGNASLLGSFAKVIKGEVFLFSMHIANIDTSWNRHDEVRTRKLLLNKREIDSIYKEMSTHQNYTLVPMKLYYSNTKKLKLELALCHGRNTHDKRDYIKDRDSKKDIKNAY